MTTLGEIVRQYGAAYRAQYGEQLLPSQDAALRAIEACGTEVLGGHLYACPACGATRYSYHSCRKRHCPTCQHNASQTWLERQQELLLPVVRYYGLFRMGNRRSLARVRSQLQLLQLIALEAMPAPGDGGASTRVVSCPSCGLPMRLERVLLPDNRGPPQLDQAAQEAKSMHVQAPSEMVCHALACFGVPERGSDGPAQVPFRPCRWQSCADACDRAFGQTYVVRLCRQVRLPTSTEPRLNSRFLRPTPT